MDRNTISEELLAKYFSGRCNAEEAKKVLAYLSAQDEHASSLMENEWKNVGENLPPRNIDRERSGYEEIANAVRHSLGLPKFSITLRIAASLILIATFTFLFYRFHEDFATVFRPIEQLTVSTVPGGHKQIMLPDGTMVWLNASSRLVYPERFGSTREVQLEGEAFFNVKENKRKPFIIRTGNFFTTVLGTSFNIKAYSEDQQIRVSVATGKVSVSMKDSALNKVYELAKLTRDQQITYFPETNSFLTESVPVHSNEWMNGHLVFRKTGIMEVASTLGRWYNKKVEVTGLIPGATCTFTANFKKGTTLQDVLETLSITQKMNYTIERERVVILAEKCLKKQ